MKRKIIVLFCLVPAAAIIMSGCSLFSKTDSSTIEISKKGAVTETVIEDFPESRYDAEAFTTYVNDTVADYLSENGDAKVDVKKNDVKNDVITLTMKYDSTDTYADFNNVECFSGTLAEAVAAGYDFSMEFISAEETDDGTSADQEPVTINGSTILYDSERSVFIVKTTANVRIPGKVKYYYAENGDAVLSGKDTVTPPEAEETDTGGLVYVIY